MRCTLCVVRFNDRYNQTWFSHRESESLRGKTMRTIALLPALALLAIASAQQSTTPQMGGWGAASSYNMLYKPETEVTIEGRVIGVAETQAPAQGMTPVTTILVKSPNGGTSTVDLGPSWYLNNLQTPVKINDT